MQILFHQHISTVFLSTSKQSISMASSSTSEQKKKIRLKSADNELFDVDEDAALQSETIKNLLQEISGDQIVPLPNVTSKILAKVIEYCSNMCELDQIISVNKQWESFFKNCDQDTLFDTILVSNFYFGDLLDELLNFCRSWYTYVYSYE